MGPELSPRPAAPELSPIRHHPVEAQWLEKRSSCVWALVLSRGSPPSTDLVGGACRLSRVRPRRTRLVLGAEMRWRHPWGPTRLSRVQVGDPLWAPHPSETKASGDPRG